jgi:phosphoesterase RecJ-like protein
MQSMRVDPSGRIAVLYLDQQMAGAAGATYDDSDGVINEPLTVKDVQAVVFFKQTEGPHYRVSLRSKGDVDIGVIAKEFGGGGHKNAAGCSMDGPIDELRNIMVDKVTRALDGRPARH